MSNQQFSAKEIFAELNGGSRLGVGVHSNVNFNGAEIGDGFMDFHFEKDGKTEKDRVWLNNDKVFTRTIKGKNGAADREETEEEASIRQMREKISRIAYYIKTIAGPEAVGMFETIDLETFPKQAALLLSEKKGTKVNLYLIYDSKGQWPTFSNYNRFLELYEEGKEPSVGPSNYELKNRMEKKNQPDSGIGKDINTSAINSITGLV